MHPSQVILFSWRIAALSDIIMTECKVRDILKIFDANKASGPDGVGTCVSSLSKVIL